MPTKVRSSNRRVKLPSKFKDHVMVNSSQDDDLVRSNVIETGLEVEMKEDGGLVENDSENEICNGVFGITEDKEKEEVRGNENDSSIQARINECKTKHISKEKSMGEEIRTVKRNTHASAVQKNNVRLDTSLCFKPTVIEEDGTEFVVFDEELVEKDVEVDNNGGCYFKFKNEEDMERVIDQWPWMVNHKPLFVQSSLGKPIRMDNITAQACTAGRGRAEFARVLVEFDVNKGFKDKIDIQYKNKKNVVKGTKK
ncbi:hypothetical protein Tco_1479812 [Tanacetum coccineum]